MKGALRAALRLLPDVLSGRAFPRASKPPWLPPAVGPPLKTGPLPPKASIAVGRIIFREQFQTITLAHKAAPLVKPQPRTTLAWLAQTMRVCFGAGAAVFAANSVSVTTAFASEKTAQATQWSPAKHLVGLPDPRSLWPRSVVSTGVAKDEAGKPPPRLPYPAPQFLATKALFDGTPPPTPSPPGWPTLSAAYRPSLDYGPSFQLTASWSPLVPQAVGSPSARVSPPCPPSPSPSSSPSLSLSSSSCSSSSSSATATAAAAAVVPRTGESAIPAVKIALARDPLLPSSSLGAGLQQRMSESPSAGLPGSVEIGSLATVSTPSAAVLSCSPPVVVGEGDKTGYSDTGARLDVAGPLPRVAKGELGAASGRTGGASGAPDGQASFGSSAPPPGDSGPGAAGGQKKTVVSKIESLGWEVTVSLCEQTATACQVAGGGASSVCCAGSEALPLGPVALPEGREVGAAYRSGVAGRRPEHQPAPGGQQLAERARQPEQVGEASQVETGIKGGAGQAIGADQARTAEALRLAPFLVHPSSGEILDFVQTGEGGNASRSFVSKSGKLAALPLAGVQLTAPAGPEREGGSASSDASTLQGRQVSPTPSLQGVAEGVPAGEYRQGRGWESQDWKLGRQAYESWTCVQHSQVATWHAADAQVEIEGLAAAQPLASGACPTAAATAAAADNPPGGTARSTAGVQPGALAAAQLDDDDDTPSPLTSMASARGPLDYATTYPACNNSDPLAITLRTTRAPGPFPTPAPTPAPASRIRGGGEGGGGGPSSLSDEGSSQKDMGEQATGAPGGSAAGRRAGAEGAKGAELRQAATSARACGPPPPAPPAPAGPEEPPGAARVALSRRPRATQAVQILGAPSGQRARGGDHAATAAASAAAALTSSRSAPEAHRTFGRHGSPGGGTSNDPSFVAGAGAGAGVGAGAGAAAAAEATAAMEAGVRDTLLAFGEALCHSQTRARVAEGRAAAAVAEQEKLLALFLRESSALYAWRQRTNALEVEVGELRRRHKAHDADASDEMRSPRGSFEFAAHWAPDARYRREGGAGGREPTGGHNLGGLSSVSNQEEEDAMVAYAVGLAFALGLGIAGAAFFFGWSMGWIIVAV